MKRQQFIVIGLGGFGETVASELTRLGHEVVGVDSDERVVNYVADSITHAVVADGSDEKALEELNVAQYDAAVVAIGENIEASLLTTLHLKTLGLKEVWVKALTKDHHRILTKIGATRILHPEYEMGMRVAQALSNPLVNNYISLGDEDYIVELIASEKLHDKKMSNLIAAAGAKVSVLLVRRDGEILLSSADISLTKSDHVVLVGKLEELRKVAHIL